MSIPDEVVNIIQEMENGNVPVMVKICSGDATEEEVDKWMEEQQIPIDEKEQVLSMLTNSFSTGGMLAEKIYKQDSQDSVNTNDEINEILEPGFPGTSKQDITNRLRLVLSEIETVKSQVITLIDQVSLMK